jgi:large subunit ribosomal protein L30
MTPDEKQTIGKKQAINKPQTGTPSAKLLIKLARSPIGTPQSHRLVLRSLGLRRVYQTVARPATPQVQGMIRKVSYLLDVRPQ